MKKLYVIITFEDCFGKGRKVTDISNDLSAFFVNVGGYGALLVPKTCFDYAFMFSYRHICTTLESLRFELPLWRSALKDSDVFAFEVIEGCYLRKMDL